jgi:hypothetical protein
MRKLLANYPPSFPFSRQFWAIWTTIFLHFRPCLQNIHPPMSSEQFKNKLRLFYDSCLPDSLRAALLSGVVADELQANTLLEERTPNTCSPQKRLLLTWVACYIENQLKRTSLPQKKYLIGELAKQEYCIGKEIKGPNDGLAITTSSNHQQEVTTVIPNRASSAATHVTSSSEQMKKPPPSPWVGRSHHIMYMRTGYLPNTESVHIITLSSPTLHW